MGQAAAFSLAGVSEGAARLAPVAGATLAVAGTALLGARLLGPAPGLLAGAALLSCALFAAFARYVRPETLFLATHSVGFRRAAAAAGARAGTAGRCWAPPRWASPRSPRIRWVSRDRSARWRWRWR